MLINVINILINAILLVKVRENIFTIYYCDNNSCLDQNIFIYFYCLVFWYNIYLLFFSFCVGCIFLFWPMANGTIFFPDCVYRYACRSSKIRWCVLIISW